MKWPFNRCRRWQTDLSLLAADALTTGKDSGIKAHVQSCRACQAKLKELQMVAAALSKEGQALPEVEATASLRYRWQTAVREANRVPSQDQTGIVTFMGRRLGWGGLAAIWALILFLRLSAPETSRPAVVAVSPPSLREMVLVLKVESREPRTPAKADRRQNQNSPPGTALPRSRRPDAETSAEWRML